MTATTPRERNKDGGDDEEIEATRSPVRPYIWPRLQMQHWTWMVNLDWEPAAFGRFDFILDAGRHCVIVRKAQA